MVFKCRQSYFSLNRDILGQNVLGVSPLLRKRKLFRRLLWLLFLIGLLNVIDFLATQDLVVDGEHLEGNLLVRGLVGTSYFAVYKLVLIPLGLVLLWKVKDVVVPKYMGWISLVGALYSLLIIYTAIVFYA